MNLKSPYDGEWSFGPLPTPIPGTVIAVVIPDRFIGVVRPSPLEPMRWLGNDGKSLVIINEGCFWGFSEGGAEWSLWEEINVWWQVV